MDDKQAIGTSLPPPSPNPDSSPYWEAAREGRLLIRECQACGTRHFMPRYLCPTCWSDKLDWIECKGRGSVYSFSVVHRAPTPAFAKETPYVVALVDLDEGPRMLANIVGERARAIDIGQRVQVTFERRGDDAALPQFMPLEVE
jgi:uncharacterized OB-fold protein